MHPNEELIERFYKSFQQRDAEGMVACYHSDVTFSDPVFPGLRGHEARSMWRMLIARGKDLVLQFGAIRANDDTGSAHWEATYTFSATGRPVHNIIDAEFKFRDGKIIEHRDQFDLWRWTRMALGPTGILLGWSPIVKNGVQKKARAGLDEFMAKHPEGAAGS